MVIRDIRDNRKFVGEFVCVLAADQPVSIGDMMRFYKLAPGSKNYDMLAKPVPQPRLVLDRGDEHFYIIPKYDFYEKVEA